MRGDGPTKDLFDPKLDDVMEPQAKSLYAIRNQLEHGYLKVHEMMLPPGAPADDDMWTDRLAVSVQRQEFEEKTLHVLRLVRACMIYLALGMHQQERRRDAAPHGLRMPRSLPLLPDSWKR